MKIRKIISLLVSVMLCVSLCFGCSNSMPEEPNIPEQPGTPDVPIEPDIPEPEIKLTSLKIGDRDISEYTIVVGDNPLRFDEDLGYDIPANAFAKEIYDRLGITLNIEKFSFEAEYGPSIVFGNTYEKKYVRPYYKSYKEQLQHGTNTEEYRLLDNYKIFSKDDTVYFLTDGVPVSLFSVERFFNDYILSFCSADSGDVVLDADFSYAGSRHVYTVGCIGDSITFGDGSTDALCAYPVVLQQLLSYENYEVINFGQQGASICSDYDWTFVRSVQYANLKKYAQNLDMAVIWLGTNDACVHSSNWNETVENDILTNFREFIHILKDANPNMKIILLTPCYNPSSEPAELTLRNHIIPLTERIAEETGSVMFDMHAYTVEKFSAEDFYDHLHPSDSGYAIVAEKVAELVHLYE